MGNSMCHFNNQELDKYYLFDNCSNREYNKMKSMYLKGALESEDSLINEFSLLRYSETVYPTQLYTNKNYTRQRTTFSFDWRDAFTDREKKDVDNGFGSTITSQSIWPLDYDTDLGNSGTSNRRTSYYGYKNDDYSNGIFVSDPSSDAHLKKKFFRGESFARRSPSTRSPAFWAILKGLLKTP